MLNTSMLIYFSILLQYIRGKVKTTYQLVKLVNKMVSIIYICSNTELLGFDWYLQLFQLMHAQSPALWDLKESVW